MNALLTMCVVAAVLGACAPSPAKPPQSPTNDVEPPATTTGNGEVMGADHVPPAQKLEEPSVAAYYGIMLAANNAPEKARHFLEIGRGANLLREERELVAKAERSIENPSDEPKSDL